MRALHSALLLLGCSLLPSLARAEPSRCTTPQLTAEGVTQRSHLVERGDSLSVIALKYGASVQAVALANGLGPDRRIRIGQSLVIPVRTRPGGGDDWLKYVRTPKQRGSLELIGYEERFHGPVVEKGRVLPSARQGISTMLGAKGTRPPVPERLIRLLVRVSDTFGGRPLRVVSGFRTRSFYADSHHKRSEAIDFSVLGVPNVVLRQYLLLLDDVGVGYYPRSSFVHLDVRACPTQWVDYSGPYEAPRRSPGPSKLPDAPSRLAEARPKLADAQAKSEDAAEKRADAPPKSGDAPRVSELDEIAEQVTSALEEAGQAAGTSAPAAAAARPTHSTYARR